MSQRKPVTDWAKDFDHLDPQWVENPWPIWRQLRGACPIAHTNRFQGVYFPSRFADVRAIAYDTEHFSSRRLMVREVQPPLTEAPPITSDPPRHRAQRMVLLPPFAPAAVGRLEPRIRNFCRRLVERLHGKRSCDGAMEYAQEIPAHVTAFLLGVAESDGSRFRQWIRDSLEGGITDPAKSERVIAEVSAYLDSEIAAHRASPRDDMISYLLDARINGEPLSDDHINGTLRLLLFAGIDTTWSAIGVALWHLATHEADRHRLAADPELIPTAVEEFLRAYAPVTIAREVVTETTIDGCHFKVGEMVMLPFGAANRDPAVFSQPDDVLIDRADNRHAAFGLGVHRCIGSHLARLEITIALQEWLHAIPQFSLAPNATVTWSAGTVRGPRTLPLTLGLAQPDPPRQHEAHDAAWQK
jgi:cytochrome P450